MSVSPEKMTCPQCGETIYSTDDVCLNCGAKLDEGRLVEESGSAGVSAPRPSTATAATDARGGEVGGDAPAVPYRTTRTGWHPGQFTGGGGLWASLSRGWAFAKESVRMGVADTDVLIPSLISIFANLIIAGAFFALMHATGQLEPMLDDEQTAQTWAYVVTVMFTLGGYIVAYVLTAMTVNMVDAYLRGEDARLDVAFADARKNFGAIVWLAVVATIVNMIASALRGKKRRGLGDLAADAVEKGWQVASYLLLPIIIIEDVSFSEATSRATKLHGQSIVQIVVGEVGLVVLQKVLGFVMFFIGVVPAVLAYFYAPALLIPAVGWAVLMIVLMAASMMYMRTAFYTCLYLWAAANETATREVAAPEPLQKALAS